jgi:hypothetical protein
MPDWSLLSGLIGGLGIGSLITSVANHLMARRSSIKDRLYQEKRETYLGMVSALQQSTALQSISGDFHLWQARCALFGSREVLKHAKEVADTPPDQYDRRNEAFQKMLDWMRTDLQRE